MKDYIYQNTLINKKQLKQLLAWSFTQYNSMQACSLADELKYLGFKYASQAGISISIEDLRVPSIKNQMLESAHKEILNAEKICLKGKITDVERFQKIIDTWSLTSELLKDEVVSYFKNYDPLNSVYIMAFSGARGNLSQVRQLVGMRGLMSDPSGEILKLPIKKNFREGLTITDYLMSGYGARKGIVDTALKTANSGYLTRRLIDVAQDIIIREQDCLTKHSCFVFNIKNNQTVIKSVYDQILGRILSKPIFHPETNILIANTNTQITPNLIETFKKLKIESFYIRSPLTCSLYRSICQKCYGWDLANENLVDIGEAVGIIAGQSIGEPGTQLTMRTFHTGGIFTAEARQQIISSTNGIIKFSKILKTITLRTNRGEDVLLSKNSGSLVIVPEKPTDSLIQLEILPNTILFSKNNQYVKEGMILGELATTDKQIRTEIKPILSTFSGEVFMPRLKNKSNFVNKNKLLWILAGQVHQAPRNSFLNFYTDHKINKNSYIFRTKLINQYSGFVKLINDQKDLFQRKIQIINNQHNLFSAKISKFLNNQNSEKYILNYKNFQYWINLENKDSKLYVTHGVNDHFASLISNKFTTQIGGIPYYDPRVENKVISTTQLVSYFRRINRQWYESQWGDIIFTNKQITPNPFNLTLRSLIWLPEETYKLDCDRSLLLVEHGSFICENFEIIPGLFSKKSGIVIITQRNNIVREISIKSGLVYQGKKFKNFANKIFYPGEIIFENIKITSPSLCQHIVGKLTDQLLIRPLDIYEVPQVKSLKTIFGQDSAFDILLKLTTSTHYLYKSNQKIKSSNNLNLISNVFELNMNRSTTDDINIQLKIEPKTKSLKFLVEENLYLANYLPAHLKYANITSCLLVESGQFINAYTTLGYFESINSHSIEIVKLKSKYKNNREILLISNDDCLTIKKEKIKNKSVNDLIIKNINVNQIGKIIIDNGKFLTIQKGRPYFFPNCEQEESNKNQNLRYKPISETHLPFSNSINTKRLISLNYYDITKKVLNKKLNCNFQGLTDKGLKLELSKMFIKKNGNLYSSPIPIFLQNFSVIPKNLTKNPFLSLVTKKDSPWIKKRRIHYSVILKNSELIPNTIKSIDCNHKNLIRVQFFGYPFSKSIGIHAITEDYFEQDVNSVFCKNGEFVADGQTIGLLNFEKEITGDIVQGLPRIEELLEARKKKQISKNVSTNQKKGLLVCKTSLDSNFEFRKLGTTIKETEKINPHNLLKAYFNYYGLVKNFFCDRTNIVNSYRLTNNYEASYRSFKKVQSLILNSVQSVYESQGVSIADKHLEVIIKQMTTKVLITHEGDTPLLPREVIDLYHIQYINDIIKKSNKQTAFYVPLLLGITKAALNNPSFISAASFQETTRVLTKAAIEGRVDWLRGLKENIIIGHLIPSGTGAQNYQHCFNHNLTINTKFNNNNFRVLKKI
uniref:DNA-directed RNA polymerase subunit beta'' n=1 Tax=Chaetoceros laevisporus TaxID=1937691 RepID=A0A8F5JA53_9STRA|nr:RNA polymerase b''-subunit [Chaetoceros laevisporus]